MVLSARSLEILTLLLDTEGPLPAWKVGKILGLSPRAVRFQLAKLRVWLAGQGIGLLAQPGLGYQVEAAPERIQRVRRELERCGPLSLVLGPADRSYRLLATLFASSRPLVVKQLQGQLGVSRGTILKDLQRLESWLARYPLKLHRRPNYGCWIDGPERDLREAWSACCIQGVGLENLLARLCAGELAGTGEIKKNPLLGHRAALLLAGLEIELFSQLVLRNPDPWFRSLTDEAQAALVVGLAIQVLRLRAGRSLPVPARLPEVLIRSEHQDRAQRLSETLAHRCGISLPDQEIAYLAEFLQRSELKRPLMEFSRPAEPQLSGVEAPESEYETRVARAVYTFLVKVAGYLHPSLAVDRELFAGLSDHLAHAAGRSPGSGEPSELPFKDLRARYRPVYEAALACSGVLSAQLGSPVSSEELDVVTLYLAAALERLRIPLKKRKIIVVCNAGRATALLLVSRIHAELPEVEVTGILSYLEARNCTEELHCDLIVSTIPVELRGVEQVVVTPFLSPEDLAKLRRKLSLASRPAQASVERCLCQLLSPDVIQLNVQADGWKEAVDIASVPLVQTGRIERRYVQAMKEVIDRLGPYMVLWPGVALLHALPENGVKELCMSIATFRTPVRFGHREHDPVDVAIVLGTADQRSHLPALFGLNRFLQNPAALSGLRKTGSLLKALKLLSTHCDHAGGSGG